MRGGERVADLARDPRGATDREGPLLCDLRRQIAAVQELQRHEHGAVRKRPMSVTSTTCSWPIDVGQRLAVEACHRAPSFAYCACRHLIATRR
nr:hypothetical protein [Deltaproteobacteria bacterium]